MKYVAVSFTLKGQAFADIYKVLEMISNQVGGKSGDTILVHGFMPRDIVLDKGFTTNVLDGLWELFPVQINCYSNGPERQRMAHILKETKGSVFTVGSVIEGVAEEVALYEGAGITVSKLGLDFQNNWMAPPLTFGQRAVGLTFNHGEGEIFKQVNQAKQTCADAIDQMKESELKSESGEYKALCTIARRKLQSAQMDMVKAITWKD